MKQSFLTRLLDPLDRMTESIYSVLIVLTFTLAYSVVLANSEPGSWINPGNIIQLFWAPLGCAVAWGIIDGIMYVLTAMFERGQQYRMITAAQSAAGMDEGVALLADQLDSELAPLTTNVERERLYRSLYGKLKNARLEPVGFKKEDFAGALGTAITAVIVAVPVSLPLLLGTINPWLAVRLSNLVSFAMLYWLGYRWGKYTGAVAWKLGLLLLLVGVLMMVIAIPMGG